MKFIDEATVEVEAGHGGRGCLSFRREKCVPFGGPDGGNGGKGGSIIIVADSNLNSLLEKKITHYYKAPGGTHGTSKLCHGKYGENVYITVPCGTKIFAVETDELIADVTDVNTEICIAVGGDGGFGNAHFKSSTNRAPRKITLGHEGERRKIRLELSVLADVGLLGLPNAGKSTLLRSISKATPKVADYPFTTLRPYLGVVEADYGNTFVVADIPGLIEGASDGAGLGIRFLKHLSRCKLLLHVIDITELDVESNMRKIQQELNKFSTELENKPCWLVFNKCDSISDEDAAEIIDEVTKERCSDLNVYQISGITKSGISKLLQDVTNWIYE